MDNQQVRQYQYKLLDSNENYKEAKIEKSGITATFTIAQIEKEIEYYTKKVKEMKSQSELEKAKMVNIEGFHPFVKDFDDKQLHTLAMYNEAKKISTMCDLKVAEVEKALKDSADEIKDIQEKLGFAVPSTI